MTTPIHRKHPAHVRSHPTTGKSTPAQAKPAPVSPQTGDRFDPAQGFSVPSVDPKSYGIYGATGSQPYVTGALDSIEAGKPLSLSYTPDLAKLGRPGEQAETVRVHYRIDGGALHFVDLPKTEDPVTGQLRFGAANIDIPASAKGELEYFYEVFPKSGGSVWDSRDGANYHANIVPAGGATVEFDNTFHDAVKGDLVQGGSLHIAYDAERLHKFLGDGWYKFGPTFAVSAFVQFDDKPPQQIQLGGFTQDPKTGAWHLGTTQPAVEIPADAHTVKLWFHAGTATSQPGAGNGMYDSNFGKNYTFEIKPRAAE